MKRKRDRNEYNATRSRINRWVRWLKKDRDWDYGFLIEMERMKIQQMADYFKDSEIIMEVEFVRRDLNLCLRLLDIVQGKDDLQIELNKFDTVAFRENGKRMYRMVGESRVISFRKLYVNVRNAQRFVNYDIEQMTGKDKDNRATYLEDIRKEKAWHLYNLIRSYRMFTWWD